MDIHGIAAFVIVFTVLEAYATPSKQGPGHHKGLYGITRKRPVKVVGRDKNNSTLAESTQKGSNLNSKGKGKTVHKVNVQKNAKRSAIDRNLDFKSNDLRKFRRSKLAFDFKPEKRDVNLKEVMVDYKKTLKEENPENSTQFIEITGNLTSSEHSQNETTEENTSQKSFNQEIITPGSEGAKTDSRSTDANMITDLKVPQMGAAIHGGNENGTAASNNASNDNGTQSAEGVNIADSRSPSPQVPNLGASIVGIVDNSNSSQTNRATLYGNETNGYNSTVGSSSNQYNDPKLKSFLDTLDEIANTSAETTQLVNSTVQELKGSSLENSQGVMNATSPISNDTSGTGKDVTANKKHEIIGPHYYEPECDDKKKCSDGHYCRMFVCVECHRSKHACTHREQCCNNMECVYGRCENKPKGSPGAFCEKDGECSGEACCVLEPTIDEEHPVCKPKLSEYHQCSPVLFRKIWIGDHKPECGPCKGGLKCVQRGVEGSHEVCMKKP